MQKLFNPVQSGCLLFMVIVWTSECTPLSPTSPPRPNILLIVADDLGYSDLGCYGGEIQTPHLDALAREGIQNLAFYTAPTCSPTRAMLLSGVDNHLCGYGTMEGDWAPNQVGLPGYEGHLNFDVVPFPQRLQAHGYFTAIAGKWHQAYPATREELWPNRRGFDRSFCLLPGGAGHFEDQQPMFSFYPEKVYAEDGGYVDTLPNGFYSSDFYTDKAIAYIEESRSLAKPFFTYLSFTAPHWPLQIPDEYLELYKGRYDEGYEVIAHERWERQKKLGIISSHTTAPTLAPNVLPWDSLSVEEQQKSARTMEIYAAMIERLDANVGKIIAHLKSTGQFEHTLIVFIADNGAEGNWVLDIVDTESWVAKNFDNRLENMGRKNSYVFTGPAWAHVSAQPFSWYKGFASEGGVRCPSMIHFPRMQHRTGSKNRAYLSVMDLAPTFLELAGVDITDTTFQGRTVHPMDGTSMIRWLEGASAYVHAPAQIHCWELYGRRGIRQGNWKATWLDQPYGSGTWELYNLQQDIQERHNLAHEHPQKLQELLKAWDLYVEKYRVTLPNEHVAYGTEQVWRPSQ